MTLAAVAGDLASDVEAHLAPQLRTLDRLAVDAAGAGSGLPAGQHANPLSQEVVDAPQSAIVTPLSKVVVDGFPRGEILGQHPPLAAVLVAAEDAIVHTPDIYRTAP